MPSVLPHPRQSATSFFRRMKRCALNPNVPPPSGRNRSVRKGIWNSAVQPLESRVTATSQIPFQFSLASSSPLNWASHMAPFGFVFRTNPNGAMWDAQFNGLDDANENWNGIWDVAVTRDSSGWTAEFQIPFRTLRFRPEGGGTFGFNAQRFIRRKNEVALWRGWGRTEGIYRLIYEGEVSGFDDLRRGRDLEVKPYVLGRATATNHDALGNSLESGGAAGKAGVDAKLAVSPTMTADLTVNTD